MQCLKKNLLDTRIKSQLIQINLKKIHKAYIEQTIQLCMKLY